MQKLKSLIHPRRSRNNSVNQKDEKAHIASFRHWMVAFVVCNFNVDVGPEIEFVYPPNTELTTIDLSAICFNSFPERQDTENARDQTFHFTVGNNSPDVKLNSPSFPHGSPDHFFGSCLFRQEFDQESKRSFNQRSLVLLSNHEFPAFFLEILREITSAGLLSDPSALEAAFTQIASWPPPLVGKQELPFMGSMLVLDIPPHYAFPLQGLQGALPPASSATHSPLIYAYQPTGRWLDLLNFMPSLTDLYTIYENMLICESIVVLSKSPQACSELVSAAVDLIRPVPYAGSVKPYVTMQSDVSSIGLDGGVPRPFVVGITNPFLLKRIIDTAEASGRHRPIIINLDRIEGQVPIKRHHSQHHHNRPPIDIPGGVDAKPDRKNRIKADRAFIESLDTLLIRAAETSQDEVTPFIRRHFAELTAQFISPINRYLATSVSAAITSPGGTYQYANFSQSSFLKSVSKYGTSVKFRGQSPIQRHRVRDDLYASFCDSLNWHSWLQMKVSLEREASAGLLNARAGAVKP